jgi:hypothetical protein
MEVVISLQFTALPEKIQRYKRHYRLDSVKYPDIVLLHTETLRCFRDKISVEGHLKFKQH